MVTVRCRASGIPRYWVFCLFNRIILQEQLPWRRICTPLGAVLIAL